MFCRPLFDCFLSNDYLKSESTERSMRRGAHTMRQSNLGFIWHSFSDFLNRMFSEVDTRYVVFCFVQLKCPKNDGRTYLTKEKSSGNCGNKRQKSEDLKETAGKPTNPVCVILPLYHRIIYHPS